MTSNKRAPSKRDIGYGRPPKGTRFQSGVSGNPKGRPKGRKNFASVLAKSLKEKVVINENGVRKTITKVEAALKQLSNKAASGDITAIKLLSSITASTESEVRNEDSNEGFDDADEKTIQGILDRIKKTMKGGSND